MQDVDTAGWTHRTSRFPGADGGRGGGFGMMQARKVTRRMREFVFFVKSVPENPAPLTGKACGLHHPSVHGIGEPGAAVQFCGENRKSTSFLSTPFPVQEMGPFLKSLVGWKADTAARPGLRH